MSGKMNDVSSDGNHTNSNNTIKSSSSLSDCAAGVMSTGYMQYLIRYGATINIYWCVDDVYIVYRVR